MFSWIVMIALAAMGGYAIYKIVVAVLDKCNIVATVKNLLKSNQSALNAEEDILIEIRKHIDNVMTLEVFDSYGKSAVCEIMSDNIDSQLIEGMTICG